MKRVNLTLEINNPKIENYVIEQLYIADDRCTETCKFNIIDSLVDGYNNTNVRSCMKGHGNFYRAFEGVGVLLVGKLEDGTEGRAIIWNNVHGLPEGCVGFMDRIYPSGNRNIVKAFKSYAVKNNLAYKLEQTWECSYFVFDNKIYDNPLYITINDEYESVKDVDELPYMNTFRYTNGDDKKIHNYAYGYRYTLNETSGVNPCTSKRCAICGTRIKPNKELCDECDDNYVYCVDTEHYVYADDAWYAKDTGEYYENRDNVIICDACGNVYTHNFLMYEQHGRQYCNECEEIYKNTYLF